MLMMMACLKISSVWCAWTPLSILSCMYNAGMSSALLVSSQYVSLLSYHPFSLSLQATFIHLPLQRRLSLLMYLFCDTNHFLNTSPFPIPSCTSHSRQASLSMILSTISSSLSYAPMSSHLILLEAIICFTTPSSSPLIFLSFLFYFLITNEYSQVRHAQCAERWWTLRI